MTAVTAWIFLQIVLMIAFSGKESSEGFQAGGDWFGPAAGFVDDSNHIVRFVKLGLIGIKNGRTISVTDVIALPVESGGVMDLKKEIEEAAEVGDVSIVGNL